MFGHDWATLLAAFTVGTIAVARVTRLIVDDDYPPILWFRRMWDRVWGTSPWVALIECPWCVAPYIAAADLAWAVLTNIQPAWWIVNGWLAVAWIAAFMCMRDIPPDQREH